MNRKILTTTLLTTGILAGCGNLNENQTSGTDPKPFQDPVPRLAELPPDPDGDDPANLTHMPEAKTGEETEQEEATGEETEQEEATGEETEVETEPEEKTGEETEVEAGPEEVTAEKTEVETEPEAELKLQTFSCLMTLGSGEYTATTCNEYHQITGDWQEFRMTCPPSRDEAVTIVPVAGRCPARVDKKSRAIGCKERRDHQDLITTWYYDPARSETISSSCPDGNRTVVLPDGNRTGILP